MNRFGRAIILSALLLTVFAGALTLSARPASADHRSPRFSIYIDGGGYYGGGYYGRDYCDPYPYYGGGYRSRRYYEPSYDYVYLRSSRRHHHSDDDDDD